MADNVVSTLLTLQGELWATFKYINRKEHYKCAVINLSYSCLIHLWCRNKTHLERTSANGSVDAANLTNLREQQEALSKVIQSKTNNLPTRRKHAFASGIANDIFSPDDLRALQSDENMSVHVGMAGLGQDDYPRKQVCLDQSSQVDTQSPTVPRPSRASELPLQSPSVITEAGQNTQGGQNTTTAKSEEPNSTSSGAPRLPDSITKLTFSRV